MALASAVAGATRPSQTITWTRGDNTAENLTGATITGTITSKATGLTRAIAGTLVIDDADDGVFIWNYHADDVATAGHYLVKFTATFGSTPTPAKTIKTAWFIYE
jgi:hypothetical protein